MRINDKGFSLVELAITLGLVGVLLSVVTAGGGMMSRSRISRETSAVDSLRIASQNYLSTQHLTYTGIGIDALKTAGFLPSAFDPVKSNAYGGDYSVSPNAADNTKVDIALGNVPQSAGDDLTATFKNKAQSTLYDKSTKVWTATF